MGSGKGKLRRWLIGAALGGVALAGCDSSPGAVAGGGAVIDGGGGAVQDAGDFDRGLPGDQGVPDASSDTALDGGPADSGPEDAGIDAGACTSIIDCGEGKICGPAGACQDPCLPGGCGVGSFCGVLRYCVDGGCAGDEYCVEGGYCADGRCLPGCRFGDDSGCDPGRECNAAHECAVCAGTELCGNGQDDDCDGVVDNPEICAGPCVPDARCETDGLGVCRAGRTTCGDDGERGCVQFVVRSVSERCDGLDDDCDGRVDESYPNLGAPCAGGQGVCAGAGRQVCSDDGQSTYCGGFEAESGPEVCDGLDNNCDGQIDEGFEGLGDGCTVGLGSCAAVGVSRCAPDGSAVLCDAAEGVPGDEICDGTDNDCDGETDELWPDLGAGCALGRGACAASGQIVCSPEGSRCDAVTAAPSQELCDGVDNDCNGGVDDGPDGGGLLRVCYDGPDGTQNVGACRSGFTFCGEGAWGACDAVTPGVELCDGVDNDCDGQVDEGANGLPLFETCYSGAQGTEGTAGCRTGRRLCAFGQLGACQDEIVPAEEICDLVDNDCNGQTDDVAGGCECQPGEVRGCYSGQDGTAGVGLCRAGEQRCVEGAVWGPCAGEVVPDGERCDGADNDCNGEIDERIEGVGEACVSGQGVCQAAGLTVCEGAGVQCAAVGLEPGAEICDGLDNDCDGQTDEAFALGAACEVGQGACRRAGQTVCAEGGGLGCSVEAAEPGVERCTGLDDDCDGSTDEGFDVGGICEVGVGQCARRAFISCSDGAAICNVQPAPAQPEICDGLDNNCDGQDDEPFDLGAECAIGLGQCAAVGVRVCAEGGGAECNAAVIEPGVELCNTLDDDCDGRIDEGIADTLCLTGRPGACAVGRRVCENGGFVCAPQVEASAEICDGIDNNCDGRIDEALGTLICGQGICLREIDRCQDGAMVGCDQPLLGAQPQELCNGEDDDCDGATDEDAVGDGGPCGVGLGACQRAGVGRCAEGRLLCDAVAGAPTAERCNLADDDCDGVVDEDTIEAQTQCFTGVGSCRLPGPQVCEDGQMRCTAVAGQPADEICNALDDDCDGLLDEGFVGGEVCGLGECRHAVAACDGGALPACDPLEGAAPELCNGLDDDCDGRIDEEPTNIGDPCGAGVGLCRREGLTRCRDGAVSCGALVGLPNFEFCDALDNDCDGRIDESTIDSGQSCSAGVGGCRTIGQINCVDALLVCDAQGGVPAEEICDGEDNDCDGAFDEALGLTTCGVGLCQRQIQACFAGRPPVCEPGVGAQLEICNGEDDDCDGRTDEAAEGVGVVCAAGLGECRVAGARVCVAGQLECGAQPGAAGVEICDALDNDCDGRTDEGFEVGAACTAGVGICERPGNQVCAGGALGCDANPGPAGVEICNGQDDDCDGFADEGLAVIGPCDTGQQGICGAGEQRCEAGQSACVVVVQPGDEICDGLDNNCDGVVDEGLGTVSCGAGGCERILPRCDAGQLTVCVPGQPAPEVCNGEDDDCDGLTDEEAVGVGGPCIGGDGVCRRLGIQGCQAGALTCDAQLGAPQAELCNQLDDDCDGTVDEQTAETQQPCFAGVGACRLPADPLCVDGQVQCPAVAGQPGVEICDTIDNDCDGLLDEGFGSVECGVGACRHAVAACDGGQAPACDPQAGSSPEQCNGVDDDCDGIVDEAAAGLFQPCSVGLGLCRRNGLTLCTDGALRCGATAADPQPEVCDAQDNDCDGAVDEQAAQVGAACVSGVGQCAAPGAFVCAAGVLSCGAAAGPPDFEICDGLDNDCDTFVDEQVPPTVCGVGLCRRQLFGCDAGQPPVCDPLLGAVAELCNGADDDCDGNTDEGLGVTNCGVGACNHDEPACLAGRANVCNPNAGGSAENCNGVDDDCDGVVDENVFGQGSLCIGGVGDCSAVGTRACIAGEMSCDARLGFPIPELCDGFDNDCDGTVDEQFDGEGDACQNGTGGCAAIGVRVCDTGVISCSSAPQGQAVPEICGGGDEDCDGLVDEGFDIGGGCSNGLGICQRPGVWQCVVGAAECDAVAAAPEAQETCDGEDDDCDGLVDEGACADAAAPVVQITVNPVIGDAGQPITIRVTATDDIGVTNLVVTVDGELLQLDANGEGVWIAQAPGQFPIVATADDAVGNQTVETDTVRIRDPNDVEAPFVRLTAPAPLSTMAGTIEIRGTVTDANLFRYRLATSADGGQTFVTVSEGFVPRNDQPVGLLHVSTLPPGLVTLRLTGEDASGNTAYHQEVYRVPSTASVGQTRLTVRDLDVPLRGFPIRVDRTYDSRLRTVGDFGIGWKLELGDIEIIEGPNSNVMIDLPNGGREVFGIVYEISPFLGFGPMRFEAPPGISSKLENIDDCLAANAPGGVVCFLSGQTPANTIENYRLTTREGTIYEINQNTGTRFFEDVNGNRVSFEPDRIFSSTGAEITLARDGQGRITQITDPLGGTIGYGYDALGRLVTVTDQVGGVQRYIYSDDHLLLEIIGPDGVRMMRTEYDAEGRKVRVIDALDNTIAYEHDLVGRREVVTDRMGEVTTYTYDPSGKVITVEDPFGDTTTSVYDAENQLTEQTGPDGRTMGFGYDANGLQTSVTRPGGAIWQYSYDALGRPTGWSNPLGDGVALTWDGGRLTQIEDAVGAVTAIAYDADGNRETLTDTMGRVFSFTYDANGLVTSATGPAGFDRLFEHDANGRITSITEGGSTTQLQWDGAGRLVGSVGPDGDAYVFERDGIGRISAIVNPMDERTEYSYRPTGQLQSVIDPLGVETRYTFDAEGRLAGRIDGNARQTTYAFDALGRMGSRTNAAGDEALFVFDPVGRLESQTDEDGNQMAFSFDVAGRVSQITYADGALYDFSYDAADRMASSDGPEGLTQFSYDPVDRVILVERPEGDVAYTYNADGSRATMTTAAGATAFGRDPLGRLAQVAAPGGVTTNLIYDVRGNVTRLELPNGVEVNYTYDVRNLATGYVATNAANGVLASEQYVLDPVGRITQITRLDGSVTTYTRDAAGQLTRSTTVAAGGQTTRDRQYTYDAVGNRTRLVRDGVTIDYQYGLLDELLADDVFDYTYNRKGQLVERVERAGGVRETFQHDDAGNLVGWARFQPGAQVAESTGSYGFDAHGNRVRTTVDGLEARVVYDGAEPRLAVTAQGQVLSHWISGESVDQRFALVQFGQTYAYVTDPRGNVVGLVDAAGQFVKRYEYDDFGEVLSAVGAVLDPFAWAGRPLDPQTGLYHNRARAYDPTTGRFVQVDPLRGKLAVPLGQNSYVYGRNDPLTYRDPMGRVAVSYAFLSLNATGGVGTPSLMELIGSLIGFGQGFGASALVFIANILDVASSGGDVLGSWDMAIQDTVAFMAGVQEQMGHLSSLGGLAGGIADGAGFSVGWKISVGVDFGPLGPIAGVGMSMAGVSLPEVGDTYIERTVGGFGNGVSEFAAYAAQLGPR